jgi:hypothetical protein
MILSLDSSIVILRFLVRPKTAQLHVGGGPFRREIFHDQITLTDETRKLDGCIIDCRYFDHQWIFTKQRLDRNHPNGRRSVIG